MTCVGNYGDFTEAYRIVIAYTEIEICIDQQEHAISGYKPYFVRLGHMYYLIPEFLYIITIVSWICMNTNLFVLLVKGRLCKNEEIIIKYMHTCPGTHLHTHNLKITNAQMFKISFTMFPSQLCNSGMIWLRKVRQQVTMSVLHVIVCCWCLGPTTLVAKVSVGCFPQT